MSQKEPRGTARTDLTRKGNQRVNDILKAASSVLVEHGIRAVNKRSVASVLGISDGNVSYYFPTKESLWLALIDYEVAAYYRRHHPDTNISTDDAQAAFDDYVGRWIDEYQDPKVRVFFSQMIAVAESSSRIAKKRDEIYEVFVETLLDLARRLEPKVRPAEMEKRVLAAIAILEGLHAVSAFRPELLAGDRRFKERIMKLINEVIRGTAT